MAIQDGARRITQAGSLITRIGGFVGIIGCLIAFTGKPSYLWPKLFLVPVVVGSVISLVGVAMEKFAKQPDVGRQTRQPGISSRSNESRFDAEHWVGGSKGFAHPALSKTHTRTSGVSKVSGKSKVFGGWLEAGGWQLPYEDDIGQLNRLGKYKAL